MCGQAKPLRKIRHYMKLQLSGSPVYKAFPLSCTINIMTVWVHRTAERACEAKLQRKIKLEVK